METLVSLVVILIFLLSTIKSGGTDPKGDVYEEVRIGLVVDLGSIEGKILETSFSLALSGKQWLSNQSLSSAIDLLHTAKVEAIVGAQSLQEAKLLAAISDKAKVPVISPLVPSSLSLNKYDHFIQLTHDITSEAKGITKLIHGFNWKSVVVIYGDVDDWREGLQTLVDHFQDDGIHIGRIASFAESSPGEDYMVYNQLRKLKSLHAAVFVVHVSQILVSRLFRCAEKLGMMEEGYAWILTARTMNHFSVVKSMQGVIGFRSYVPESEQVTNFTSRLGKLMVDDENAEMETKHFSLVISVWAHDIAYILATAVEKIRLRASDDANVSNFLETIRQSRFKGLSDIQIAGKKFLTRTFEIVNMVETGERRVGLWTSDNFYGRRHIMVSSTNELETIIWPGGTGRIPRHRILTENVERKLLRVLVTSRNWFPHLVAVRFNTFTGFCIVC